MSVNFSLLPIELWEQKIIPTIPGFRTLLAVACTSKWACERIRYTAQYVGDIDLSGKHCTFICDKDTTSKEYVFQIFKIRVLNNHPELLEALANARKFVQSVGADPDNIACLSGYWLKREGKGSCYVWEMEAMLSGWKSLDHDNLTPAILLFDFQTQIIKAGPDNLGGFLAQTIVENKVDLAHLILAHPESKNIAENDLGIALLNAITINDLPLVRTILALPNAKKIPADDSCPCFVQMLSKAIHLQRPKLALIFASHPNAIDIPLDNSMNSVRCLSHYVYTAAYKKNPKLIAAVLYHPKIIDLPEIDLYRAGKAMLSEQDLASLHQLQEIIGDPSKLKEIRKTFRMLSVGTRYFLFLMLCKIHGRPQGNIETDGPYHLAKQPKSLLPIIIKLCEK